MRGSEPQPNTGAGLAETPAATLDQLRAGLSRASSTVRAHAPVAVLLTVIWLGLVGVGLPCPHIDDVWYVDPAINVALTGRLESPALARVLAEFGTRHYFLSFPFYPLLVGAWLRAWGISFASLAAFWVTCGVASSLALRELLRAFGAGRIAQVAVLAYFPFHVQTSGLRPEPAGYAFSLVGAALLLRPTPVRAALGCLCTCAAVGCAPNFVVAAPSFALMALYLSRKTPGLARRLVLCGAGAAFVTAALLTLAIGGHFGEFARQVSTMSRVTFSRGQTLSFVAAQLFGGGFAKLRMGPLYAAYLALVLVASIPRGRFLPARARSFVIGTGLALLVSIAYRARSFDVLNPAVFASLLIAAPAVASRLGKLPVATALCAVGAASVVTSVVNLVLMRPPDAKASDAALRRATACHGHVVVDEFSARYVYDYRYPRDAISFHHQRALDDPSGFEARAEFKRPAETWVVSHGNLCKFAPTFADGGCEGVQLFGRRLRNSYANGQAISVVGATERTQTAGSDRRPAAG